ncbi:IclR family transcriptional regulator [Gordonia sp. C13]|uniref:IclR family transcriptional regulator n=1 Tax=Gordonia sp. C13 TaxID=2935078 RepID=UPI00200B7386|nr:IclR family transcriptional regulator [Gordonia sp. C13]
MSLLAAFGSEAATGVGVSELGRRAGLSKSTAFRVLAMLERNGFVERAGTDYRLGTRLHDLGRSMQAPGQDRLRDLLIPFVTDLFTATGETVHLAVLQGTDVVYLAKLYGHRHFPSPSRIGGRMPAHCTAVGKALLAYDPEHAQRVLDGPMDRPTERTIHDPAALTAELALVRRQGIAVEINESRPGLTCVAAPILVAGGRPVAALSVAGQAGRLDVDRHAAVLRRVANAAARTVSIHASLKSPDPRMSRQGVSA